MNDEIKENVLIKLTNINKDYKKGKKSYNALNNVSFELYDKEFVSIVGPSGCGKTTLLNIIGGLDTSYDGIIQYYEKNYKNINIDSFRNQKIGFVFQNFYLIENLTVYDNIALKLSLNGDKNIDKKKKILNYLEKFGLQDKEHKKPKELSGGEMQRVAIIRAIISNPDIILADEPTGALDSKTSKEVVEILKELSKTKLVIMVTHNQKLANTYSDRIIELFDGKISNIKSLNEEEKEITKIDIENEINIENRIDLENEIDIEKKKEKELKKVGLSLFKTLNLGIKNMISKMFRTIAMIFSGSIGLVAVLLVVTLSSGVSTYINKLQTDTLKTSPILISNSTKYSSSSNISGLKVEYPDTNEVLVSKINTTYEHKSMMNEEFINLVENLSTDKYTIIDYGRSIRMKLYSKTNTSYQKQSISYFYEMNEESVMENEYDVIYGHMPTQANEVALLVDRYNAVNSYIIENLGFDSSVDTIDFDDILEKKYYYITNDEYYNKNELGYYEPALTKEKIDKYGEEITICGILRVSKEMEYSFYNSGILYTKELTKKVLEDASNSEIVKKQLEYGLDCNVLTGKPFEDRITSSYIYRAQYLYEEQLLELCIASEVTSIEIYTKSFEDREYIENYIKNSTEYKELTNPYYRDYMSNIAKDFATFIKVLTKVLIIFALISLCVSTIMISTIFSINVNERKQEIGIIRSNGARKIDIIKIFSGEALVCGFLSGLLGFIFANIIKNPINTIVQNLIKDNVSGASSVIREKLIIFDKWNVVILLAVNIILTLLATIIPSIKASKKDPVKVLKEN